jgi:hypothetical protein
MESTPRSTDGKTLSWDLTWDLTTPVDAEFGIFDSITVSVFHLNDTGSIELMCSVDNYYRHLKYHIGWAL